MNNIRQCMLTIEENEKLKSEKKKKKGKLWYQNNSLITESVQMETISEYWKDYNNNSDNN
jgi:hypothetical protein